MVWKKESNEIPNLGQKLARMIFLQSSVSSDRTSKPSSLLSFSSSFSVAATAQNIGSAPTPSPDAGAAFSLSISSAVIGYPSPVGGSAAGGVALSRRRQLGQCSRALAAESVFISLSIGFPAAPTDGNNAWKRLPCFPAMEFLDMAMAADLFWRWFFVLVRTNKGEVFLSGDEAANAVSKAP
nr:hypothetical protein Iba_chr08aCG10830 [Ipomoea batatas]